MSTLDATHLFYVNEDCIKLKKFSSDKFHHITANILFLGERVRPFIQTSVVFLTKRVKYTNDEDYNKIQRTVKYLRYTKYLVLKIYAEASGTIYWWVDETFALNNDMRIHTGGMI